MSAPLEQRHIDILARDVLDCRVARFAEDLRIAAVCQYPAADRDHDPSGVSFDRDGMFGPRNLDRLRFTTCLCGHASRLLQLSLSPALTYRRRFLQEH